MMNTHDHGPDDGDTDPDLQGVRRPPLRTRSKFAIAGGLIALTAVASYFGWWYASVPVRWQEVGFSVTSSSEIAMTFDVFLYTDAVVTCELEALNRQYAQVGVAYVTVDPADGNQQRMHQVIATVEEATTAVVSDCRP